MVTYEKTKQELNKARGDYLDKESLFSPRIAQAARAGFPDKWFCDARVRPNALEEGNHCRQ